MKYKLYSPLIFILTLVFSCHVYAQEDGENTSAKELMIIEQENTENKDSINFELFLTTLPLIDEATINKVEPKIRKWLSAFHLNIKDFRLERHKQYEGSFDWDVYKEGESMYYSPFKPEEDDIYEPSIYDYSPDKNMYIDVLPNMGVVFENDTIKGYGTDDCQNIYLTNRKLKKKVMVLWLGSSQIIFDCFWINNSQFILVSGLDDLYLDFRCSYKRHVFHFYLYDVSKNGGETTYISKSNVSVDEYFNIGYFWNFNLKKRGYPVVKY